LRWWWWRRRREGREVGRIGTRMLRGRGGRVFVFVFVVVVVVVVVVVYERLHSSRFRNWRKALGRKKRGVACRCAG